MKDNTKNSIAKWIIVVITVIIVSMMEKYIDLEIFMIILLTQILYRQDPIYPKDR